MRTKFPSQIAGIIYTRKIVNGPKTNPLNEVAILGNIIIGMIA